MNTETFIFDTPYVQGHVSGLKMCANRYTMRGSQPQDGFTLIACHGLGQRQYLNALIFITLNLVSVDKEQWEPVLQRLFALNIGKAPGRRVYEVWALEWQSHGESFMLNKELIGDNEKAASKLVF
jgi:hypothetical protein